MPLVGRKRTPSAPISEWAGKSIQAITFDVGGTLIAPWPSVGHVYAQVAAEHGLSHLPVEALNRQFAQAWRRFKGFRHTRAEWAELVDAAFNGLSDSPASRTLFSEIYQRFAEPEAWHIFEDVVPALSVLAERGVRLAVVSNWDERLRPLLGRLNLLDYFEAVIVSCEVGFPKPSRAIFDAAARELALPATAILHVGDSVEMDVRGARAAGWQAVLVHRAPNAGRPGQIASLRDLYQAPVRSGLPKAPRG